MNTKMTHSDWLNDKENELQLRLNEINKKIQECELTKREIVGYHNAIRDEKIVFARFLSTGDSRNIHK